MRLEGARMCVGTLLCPTISELRKPSPRPYTLLVRSYFAESGEALFIKTGSAPLADSLLHSLVSIFPWRDLARFLILPSLEYLLKYCCAVLWSVSRAAAYPITVFPEPFWLIIFEVAMDAVGLPSQPDNLDRVRGDACFQARRLDIWTAEDYDMS